MLNRLVVIEFERELARTQATVINVHVPYDGELDGTDAFVPFERIVGDPALPTDRDAPILLYCQSGRMSQIAGEALVAEGYRDVADLFGGMDAWAGSGRPIRRDGPAG